VPPEVIIGVRKLDASSKQYIVFSKWPRCWNQMRNIIEEPRSSKTFALGNGNNSVLWNRDQSFMTWQNIRLYSPTKVPVYQRGRVIRKNAPRGLLQSWKCWFRGPRAIVAKISIDCWCKRANNASNYLRYKSYTLKTRQMLSEAVRTSLKLFASVPILASLQPRFKLDYYVRSIERVTSLGISMWRH